MSGQAAVVRRIPEAVVREVRERTDVVALMERYAGQVSKAGAHFKACCPVHGERTPSLQIYTDQPATPYHCFGCGWHGDAIALVRKVEDCSFHEAVAMLGRECGVDVGGGERELAKLPPRPEPEPRHDARDDWTPILPVPADAPPAYDGDLRFSVFKPNDAETKRWPARHVWAYRDLAGRLLGYVIRMEIDGRKLTPTVTYCEGPGGERRWCARGFDDPRPLYNLRGLDLLPDDPVVVAEGEKAADAAAKLTGWPAITSPGGSKAAAASDWSPVAGRHVIVWPDYDQAGQAYAHDVAERAKQAGVACVQTVNLADLQAYIGRDLAKGSDAADISLDEFAGFDLRENSTTVHQTAPAGDGSRPPPSPPGPVDSKPPPGDDGDDDKPKQVRQHQRLIRDLDRYLAARHLVPDGVFGWRDSRTWREVDVDVSTLADDIWEDLRATSYAVAADTVQRTLTARTDRLRRARRAELREQIAGSPATDAGRAALRRWVEAVTDPDVIDPDDAAAVGLSPVDLAEVVMLHWIWNAKRLVLGMPTKHDVMVLLYGAQGGGKTVATDVIASAWCELALDIDASYMTDEKKIRILSMLSIARWEEMQGATRADVEALKHTITSPRISYRPMRTNVVATLPKACSFIGTSNKTVDQMVADTTGARRFFQINAKTQLDWDTINELAETPELIWQAIGVDDDSPLLRHLEQLRAHQAHLVHKDPVALWLETERWRAREIIRADSDAPELWDPYRPDIGVTLDEVGARFGYWARGVNQTPVGSKTLSQRMTEICGQRVRRKLADGSRIRAWILPPELDPTQTPQEADDAPF